MDLLLIRHGKAFDADPMRWPDDSQRPLTPQGETDLRQIARGLAAITDAPDVVRASSFPRAARTAEILAQGAGWPPATRLAALEGADAGEVVRAVRRDHDDGTIALVGHEPNLSGVVATLLGGVRIELKKAGVVRLQVGGRGTTLVWVLPPKVLRAAGAR